MKAPFNGKQFVIVCVILACIFLLMGLVNEKVDALEKRVYTLESSQSRNTP